MPTKIMINESRKSTIFTATQSDSQTSALLPVVISIPDSMIKIYFFNKPTYKFIPYSSLTSVLEVISRALSAYSQDLSLDQTILSSKDPKSTSSFILDY